MLAIFHGKRRTIRNIIGNKQAIIFLVHDTHLTGTAYYDLNFFTLGIGAGHCT